MTITRRSNCVDVLRSPRSLVTAAATALLAFGALTGTAAAAPSCAPAPHANCAGVDLSGMDLRGPT